MEKFVKKKVVAFIDLSLAYHMMDGNRLWVNVQEFNSNSQVLNSYKTCIVTAPLRLAKAASCQKRHFCSTDRATTA